jgi:RimJ/RimL family protein N-acetyltransferase
MEWPVRLETDRLILRPFRLEDAPDVARLAGEREIAETTLNIPHPYEESIAVEWIARHTAWAAAGESYVFAINRREEPSLIGALELGVEREHERAELGYWIERSCWNLGYATEATRAAVAFGFGELGLHRIQANHFSRNGASGSVLLKAGFTYEGCLRGSVLKWGEYEDLHYYSILATDSDDGKPEMKRERNRNGITERV